MATIYRFVIEQKAGRGGSGSTGKRANKGAAKKGRDLPLLFGGSKGGVEHNRLSRAVNPIFNKITGGVYEKGVRITRAAAGMFKYNQQTGKIGVSLPAIAIIIAFALIQTWNMLNKWNQRERASAEKANTSDFKRLENGTNAIHGAYKVVADSWSGRITYNENK